MNDAIKFEDRTIVRLGKKIIGEIRPDAGGFRYYPEGEKWGGDWYATVVECKRSLLG